MCDKLLQDLTGGDKGKIIDSIEYKLDEEGGKYICIRYTDGTWKVIDIICYDGEIQVY